MAQTPLDTPLVLSRNTVTAAAGFRTFVEAAATAGYDGIGLRPKDRERALAEGLRDADLRAILRGNGLELVELEYHRDFALAGEAGARAVRAEQPFYALADALGGRHLFVISNVSGSIDDAAERFAAMCDRAAAHGISIALEYVPYFDIGDISTAWEVVRRAERANSGVLVDSWHHVRGGGTADDVRAVPAERIIAIQVNDGLAKLVGTLREDTIHRRVMPGDGVFDLTNFVDILVAHGVHAPWCVEVPGDLAEGLTAVDAARRSADGMRRVFAAHRRKER